MADKTMTIVEGDDGIEVVLDDGPGRMTCTREFLSAILDQPYSRFDAGTLVISASNGTFRLAPVFGTETEDTVEVDVTVDPETLAGWRTYVYSPDNEPGVCLECGEAFTIEGEDDMEGPPEKPVQQQLADALVLAVRHHRETGHQVEWSTTRTVWIGDPA